MSKAKKYTVLHAQNILGAAYSVGDEVELTDAQAKYLIGNAIDLAKPDPEPKRAATAKTLTETPASSKAKRKHRDRTK